MAARLASPTEQVVLEVPALRARRLVRLQVAAIVVVSIAAGLLGMLCVALPAEDRAPTLLALVVLVTVGGMFVGLTDYVHGQNVGTLIQMASQLRQSAAERAADLARVNAELRRRDAERSSLFATMSHELRTPLSSIIGYSRALLDGVDGGLNDEQRADVRHVHQSANGLLGIVNRTLDFARLDAGSVTLRPGPVQIWPVVEEVVAALQPMAAARGLDLDRAVPPNLPPVEADEESLRQVLVNLVVNAVKFTETGRVAIRAEEAEDRVTIAVSDTGIGIAREAHELVFEPFRQLNPGTVHGNGGTGLGLAICERLVRLMDGRIWVESEAGAGSTFSVSLPVARLQAVAVPSQAPVAATCDVVVVGDPVRCRPLVASLRSRGLEARNVSGPTAIHDVTAAAPRLVLIDGFLQHAAAWRHLAALRAAPEQRDRRVGLVGLADGGGRLVVPSELDVLASSDLEITLAGRVQALYSDADRHGASVDGRVLVVGADITWRRRVSLVLEARGIRVAEAAHADEVCSVAQRVPVRGIVADLLLPDPGVAELLSTVDAEESIRHLPVLLVGPGALSPGQQRDLRRELMRWSRERAVPVSDLAGSVARLVADDTRALVGGAAVGEGTWRAH